MTDRFQQRCARRSYKVNTCKPIQVWQRFTLSLALLVCVFSGTALANEKEFRFEPRPLDGVDVEVLEVYKTPKPSEIHLALTVFPLDPFFTGLGVAGGYTYKFGKTWGWEVVNAQYVFGIQRALTSELAENHGVAPEEIEILQNVMSTNIDYVHSYGKMILFGDSIKYFRSGFLAGGGFVKTDQRGLIGASVGLYFDIYVNDTFSWRIESRDIVTFSGGVENYLSFNIGTGVNF